MGKFLIPLKGESEMAKLDMKKTTAKICEALRQVATLNSDEEEAWADERLISTLVFGNARPGSRRVVRQVLGYLVKRRDVKKKRFLDGVGYRIVR